MYACNYITNAELEAIESDGHRSFHCATPQHNPYPKGERRDAWERGYDRAELEAIEADGYESYLLSRVLADRGCSVDSVNPYPPGTELHDSYACLGPNGFPPGTAAHAAFERGWNKAMAEDTQS